jgi:large subunit ribosomal protein L23
MAKQILIKPIVTEKSDLLSEKLNQYTFLVDKKANKVEIRKAVEEMYGVTVDSVNTAIMPGKAKNRSTRTAVLKGRVSSYKKAIITLSSGDEIDFFGDI